MSLSASAPTAPLLTGRVPLRIVHRPQRELEPHPRPQRCGRVVIVSATVGQGHEGAARELAQRLEARGVQVEVHDFLDALPAVARRALRDLYRPTVQYTPALFERLFRSLEHDGVPRRTTDWICRSAEETVGRWARGADVVVTTYPLAAQSIGALREQGRLDAPALTYLTDPAAHALWCHRAVDVHLTVTRATARDAARYGVAARAAGPLCARDFSRARRPGDATRTRVRAELELPSGAPVALLSAGSLGMGAVPTTVDALLHHPAARVVVLCGRNESLRRRLARSDRVVALGWRDDVPELMTAADVMIHNAGGLSFTEALVAGLPAVTYLPIPGHGRANAELLARAGIAPWPRSVAELVEAVDTVCARPRAPRQSPWPAGADPVTPVLELLPAVSGLMPAASGF